MLILSVSLYLRLFLAWGTPVWKSLFFLHPTNPQRFPVDAPLDSFTDSCWLSYHRHGRFYKYLAFLWFYSIVPVTKCSKKHDFYLLSHCLVKDLVHHANLYLYSMCFDWKSNLYLSPPVRRERLTSKLDLRVQADIFLCRTCTAVLSFSYYAVFTL